MSEVPLHMYCFGRCGRAGFWPHMSPFVSLHRTLPATDPHSLLSTLHMLCCFLQPQLLCHSALNGTSLTTLKCYTPASNLKGVNSCLWSPFPLKPATQLKSSTPPWSRVEGKSSQSPTDAISSRGGIIVWELTKGTIHLPLGWPLKPETARLLVLAPGPKSEPARVTCYRGTSLIRTPPPVGPCSGPMPGDLWWS